MEATAYGLGDGRVCMSYIYIPLASRKAALFYFHL